MHVGEEACEVFESCCKMLDSRVASFAGVVCLDYGNYVGWLVGEAERRVSRRN